MAIPHFSELIFTQAQKYGDRNVLFTKSKDNKEWQAITWNQLSFKVKSVAKAMLENQITNHTRVGILAPNMAESIIVDYAAFAIRAITVPIFPNSSLSQVEYIVNNAALHTLFVGEQEQYDIAQKLKSSCASLQQIVVFDADVDLRNEEAAIYFSDYLLLGERSTQHFEVEGCQSRATEDQPATILYTSGTTGESKGVVLTHQNFIEAIRVHDAILTSVTDKDKSICFLPISHVFERTWTHFMLYKGVAIYINKYSQDIQKTIKEVRPTLMCAVPRFWEKVYIAVNDTINNYNPVKRGIVTWALAVGKQYNIDNLRINKKPSLCLRINYGIADKLVFSKLKKTMGIENANMLPTAGAALSDEISIYFRSLGIPIVYGYGLTETTATVACYPYQNYRFGTVGKIIPGLEVKIGADDEVLVKGPTVFSGYFNRPDLNAQAFTADGFFRTGDAGRVEGGEIVLTDRIKDLFKTSNGKYIAPQSIETKLTSDKYFDQVVVVGDNRNFVTAIVVPAMGPLAEYASSINIKYNEDAELIKNAEIIAFYEKRIAMLQKEMASYEQIKKFTLVKTGFTIESGEITNTLKLRRAIIQMKYKDLIEEMYK